MTVQASLSVNVCLRVRVLAGQWDSGFWSHSLYDRTVSGQAVRKQPDWCI